MFFLLPLMSLHIIIILSQKERIERRIRRRAILEKHYFCYLLEFMFKKKIFQIVISIECLMMKKWWRMMTTVWIEIVKIWKNIIIKFYFTIHLHDYVFFLFNLRFLFLIFFLNCYKKLRTFTKDIFFNFSLSFRLYFVDV